MRAGFQAPLALIFAVSSMLGGLVSTRASAGDEITPMYEGELSTYCYYLESPFERRTWFGEQEHLITEAEGKARKFIARECHDLYHGRFSQAATEWFSGHKSGHCEITQDPLRKCHEFRCFGYSAGTCTTPGRHRQADTTAVKTAPAATTPAAAAPAVATAGQQPID